MLSGDHNQSRELCSSTATLCLLQDAKRMSLGFMDYIIKEAPAVF